MNFKIIGDSCCDTNEALDKEIGLTKVPLTIYIDDKVLRDDSELEQRELLRLMKGSENAPRTASPSPGDFMKEYEGNESVFVVTLSSKLSGTYSSAVVAKDMTDEANPNKFIHVFDSLSASIAETLISLKILELVRENYKELEIVDKVNAYIQNMKTLFVLESLDNLIKAGRMSKLMGKIGSVLSIKPIMGADKGSIKLVEKVRGANKAFKRMVELIGEQGHDLEERILGIAHCNALERAEEIKREALKRFKFKDVIIVETAGISTVYANDGGVIIAF